MAEQVSFVMRRKNSRTAEKKAWLCMAGYKRPYHSDVIERSYVGPGHSLNRKPRKSVGPE